MHSSIRTYTIRLNMPKLYEKVSGDGFTVRWEGVDGAYLSDELIYLNMYLGNYMEACDNTKYLYYSKLSSIGFKDALMNLEDNSTHYDEFYFLYSYLKCTIVKKDNCKTRSIYRYN